MNARFDFGGRTALVTGGTRGIGRAIAGGLAEHGAHVVVSSRKTDAVERTIAEIVAAGGRATGIPANVGRIDEGHALIDRVVAECGGLDILVNNAAANPVFGPVEETTPEAFSKIFDVNVRAPFELAKRALPALRRSGQGAIVNVSSIGGLTPERGLGIYSVSKAALIGLTQVMAKEWGPHGIRANAICPGFIKTDFSRVLWSNEETMSTVLRDQPIARLGTPEEVAQLALFLASDASGFCTGGVYLADGGYLLG
jgi:NAD(P)-dependent dehydrogenase (short-subunit alcohol dehydrogenase family)